LVLAGLMMAAPCALAQGERAAGLEAAAAADLAAAGEADASAATLVRAMRHVANAQGTVTAAAQSVTGRRVHVVLLDEGRALGRGTGEAWTDALARAFSEARGSMDRGADALQQAAQERRLRDARISVEVGGAPAALNVAMFAQVDLEVRAGLEGIAVMPPEGTRVADGSGLMRTVVVFPSEMMARGGAGQSPSQALIGAISEASGDATTAMAGVAGKELGDLVQAGWSIERFGVTHAVELVKGGPAVTLTRGAALVPASAITLDALRTWRDNLREHLASRVDVGEFQSARRYGVSGWIEPQSGTAHDRGDRTQMHMAAMVLAASHPELAEGLLGTSLREDGTPPKLNQDFTPVERATLVRAALALPEAARDRVLNDARPMLERPGGALADLLNPDGSWKDGVPAAQRGLILWAHAGASGVAAMRVDGHVLERAVRSLLASAPPAALVTHMPWLAWAADEVSGEEGAGAGGAVLREMRSQVWQAQVGPELAKSEGADLEGALLFGTGAQARRSIGWQTARPVGGIARMLASDDITSADERMGEIVRLVASLRFLRQLTMDEASVWNCEEPERVLWGVRNGPWDRRMSIEASVMTLMAVDESIKALEAIK
jgi:hypothetical protein